MSKKEKIELKIFYTKYADKIKDLKEEIVSDFKSFMTEKYGFVFIAEWLDLREASIYNDKFLARIEHKLYRINMSQSQGSININNLSFRRFDTVNMTKVWVCGADSAYGYYIDKEGMCINKLEKNRHPYLYSSTYTYLYRDLLRKNKIMSLLNG